MAKIDILKSFKQKKFRYGGYATLLTMIVFAVVVAINLVVGQANLKLDLTKNKLFSLSEQTDKITKDLQNDVKIIGLYQAGKEDPSIKEILDKYTAKSKKISVEFVDPNQHPELVREYQKSGETLSEGSLVVVSGTKNKIVNSADLYNYDQESGSISSLAVEQMVSGAIMYVTSSKNPTVYNLQGHNEQPLSPDLTKGLGNQNYNLKDLNLFSGEWTLESGDIIVINSPQRDLSPEEVKKIKDGLSKGGRAVFFMDFISGDVSMTNMTQLLNSYGVNVPKALIYEGNPNNTVTGNKLYLVPNMSSHEILAPLVSSKLPVVIPAAQAIETLTVKKSSIKVEPILTTSDKAFAKVKPSTTTVEKVPEDKSGPFNIAVAVTDEVDPSDTTKNAKLIVITSSIVMDSQLIAGTNGGNLDLLMNSFNWLSEKKENISIAPKSLRAEALKITAAQQITVAGISVILIPVIIAALGISVWLRRRHL